MGVLRATYFDECLRSGVPFQDRANVPPEAFIKGREVVDLWQKFGYAFLIIISYPWLSKEHPDPHCYHLPRLVRALKAFRAYHEQESWTGENAVRVRELGGGVLLDFCSFAQGTRTKEEDRIFKEGLELINIPYGHSDVTALKLTSTPDSEARRYDDRGWTHFESTVIDGKAPSSRHGWGERNVLTCDDAFAPTGDADAGLLEALGKALRKPPLTPKRFREELEVRRLRAEAKNERLFTNGKDSPVILERYDASFNELCRSKKLDYTGMRWAASEAKELAFALPFFGVLEELVLLRNWLDGEAATALAAALPQCHKLRILNLSGNQLGEGGEEAAALATALGKCPTLEEVLLSDNSLGKEAAAALAIALPQCGALRILSLEDNQLGNGAEAGAALATAFGSCPTLEQAELGSNELGPQVAAALATALPQCGALRVLHLGSNLLGNVAEAAAALAAAVGRCPTLEEVHLNANELGPEAAAALATALPECCALRFLHLGNNHLGNAVEAAVALATALGSCPSLEEVNLDANDLGPEAAAALAVALPQCRALLKLHLLFNALGSEGEAALTDAWCAAGKDVGDLELGS